MTESDQKIKIYCVGCKGFTNHDVLKKVTKTFTPDNTPNMQIDFAEGIWEILECRGCESVTFRETWINSEDVNPETGEPEAEVRLYPARNDKMLDIKPHFGMPLNLRQFYRETIDCYNQGLNTLCAIGTRMLIESICLDKGIKDDPVLLPNGRIERQGNLQGKIEGLAKSGLITAEHAKTLHQLRVLGNEAAHQLQAPSVDELQTVLEIVEHTLENVYGLAFKTEDLQFKKRMRPKK